MAEQKKAPSKMHVDLPTPMDDMIMAPDSIKIPGYDLKFRWYPTDRIKRKGLGIYAYVRKSSELGEECLKQLSLDGVRHDGINDHSDFIHYAHDLVLVYTTMELYNEDYAKKRAAEDQMWKTIKPNATVTHMVTPHKPGGEFK